LGGGGVGGGGGGWGVFLLKREREKSRKIYSDISGRVFCLRPIEGGGSHT